MAKSASRAIFINNSGRRGYIAGAKRGGMPHSAIVNTRHILEAVDVIQESLQPGDAVLINKGRNSQRLARIAHAQPEERSDGTLITVM